MTAYVVMIREETSDPAEMALYREKAPLAREGHDVSAVAFYGAQDVLEGPEFEGAAILAFPDMDAARAWYDSPAYQVARQHRQAGSRTRVFLIDGV
ncbi:DUF1330 domain-containing protein [Roseivivax sediminis]|uniref:Uncharacterized conserved protein, DUF1330 family n=1 Tax=Roseivivax sediminis TaxID=936889 RepID=A0A1I1SYZ4_9RHOB|nr:DUF1330 domain-containing protein [Roseivivax sediminis]SFD51551.1 Uncharacterized conserved protein, DUF1330 family [Roseivivax sediminis]